MEEAWRGIGKDITLGKITPVDHLLGVKHGFGWFDAPDGSPVNILNVRGVRVAIAIANSDEDIPRSHHANQLILEVLSRNHLFQSPSCP